MGRSGVHHHHHLLGVAPHGAARLAHEVVRLVRKVVPHKAEAPCLMAEVPDSERVWALLVLVQMSVVWSCYLRGRMSSFI